MQRISALILSFSVASSAIAQDVPMGCYVIDYSRDHLAQNPEQVVDRMSILFSQEDWGVVADVQVLLADQGHAARDKNGGMRVSEVASNFNKSLVFILECDGGIFGVISNNATGIVIETSWFRLSDNGCGGGGFTRP